MMMSRLIESFALSREGYFIDDDKRRIEIADAVLAQRPDDPFATFLKWQTLSVDEPVPIEPLEQAVRSVREMIDEDDTSPKQEIDDVFDVYSAMLSELCADQYFSSQKDDALSTAEEFREYRTDGDDISDLIFYSLLIERGEFERAIKEADGDMLAGAFAEHCRAISIYEIDGPTAEATDALLEAVSNDPKMAFGVMTYGYDDEDDDDIDRIIDDEDVDHVMRVSMLAALWTADDERFSFFASALFAVSYLLDIFANVEDSNKELEKTLKRLGCLDAMRSARSAIRKMRKAGAEMDQIFNEAISQFMRLRDEGFLD